jgi:hypothetical protein
MWGRAERQAGNGAGTLFAHLNDAATEREAGIAALERLLARVRAGEWSDDLAELIARATLLDRAPGANGTATGT